MLANLTKWNYAAAQNNIGNAYSNLAEVRDKETNLEKVIDAYQDALKIRTVESYPIDYATTHSNIGAAYGDLAEVRDKKTNLEKTIDAYQEALKVYAIKSYPMRHVQIQTRLEKIS